MQLTIYRKQAGATTAMLNASHVENVWGVGMLVKTIDASDADAVQAAKDEGWQDKPQAVIDEIEGDRLAIENARLQRQIDSAKAIERVAELEKEKEQLLQQVTDLTRQLNSKRRTAKVATNDTQA